jgi:vancomycin resistance protein VanJ
MIALIREADAALVALQELSPAAAARFADEFADQYPYQALHPNSTNAIWGQGFLSRYPLLSDEYWHINLGHQRVEFQVGDEPVTLYNTHPVHPFFILEGRGFNTQLRAQEISAVLDRAAQDTGAVVIAGDFNMPDQSDDYQRITAQYMDTYREVGWGLGLTFPDFSYANAVPDELPSLSLPIRPLVRLDYIFHSDALTALEARVWPTSGGSDHRPVFARLAIGVG